MHLNILVEFHEYHLSWIITRLLCVKLKVIMLHRNHMGNFQHQGQKTVTFLVQPNTILEHSLFISNDAIKYKKKIMPYDLIYSCLCKVRSKQWLFAPWQFFNQTMTSCKYIVSPEIYLVHFLWLTRTKSSFYNKLSFHKLKRTSSPHRLLPQITFLSFYQVYHNSSTDISWLVLRYVIENIFFLETIGIHFKQLAPYVAL